LFTITFAAVEPVQVYTKDTSISKTIQWKVKFPWEPDNCGTLWGVLFGFNTWEKTS